MHASPSNIDENKRARITEQLNALLATGLDLHTQVKVAHWNVKGPHFAELHAMFEGFGTQLLCFTDDIAERAVTLGALAQGTARQAASASVLPEYDGKATRGLEHVRLLAMRFRLFVDQARSVRDRAAELGDPETVDLLQGVVAAFEKNGWFLAATLEG